MNYASINIFIKIHIGVWNISRSTAIPYIWYKCTEIACIHTEYSLPTSTLKFCPHISSGGLFWEVFPKVKFESERKVGACVFVSYGGLERKLHCLHLAVVDDSFYKDGKGKWIKQKNVLFINVNSIRNNWLICYTDILINCHLMRYIFDDCVAWFNTCLLDCNLYMKDQVSNDQISLFLVNSIIDLRHIVET